MLTAITNSNTFCILREKFHTKPAIIDGLSVNIMIIPVNLKTLLKVSSIEH